MVHKKLVKSACWVDYNRHRKDTSFCIFWKLDNTTTTILWFLNVPSFFLFQQMMNEQIKSSRKANFLYIDIHTAGFYEYGLRVCLPECE